MLITHATYKKIWPLILRLQNWTQVYAEQILTNLHV